VRSAAVLGWVALLAAACAGERAGEVQRLTLSPDTLFIGAPQAVYAPGYVQDTLAIQSIHDLELAGDSVIVGDYGGRVIVFDPALRPVRSLGRPGSGPGEFRGVVGVAVRERTVAIGDARNARIALMDLGGAHLEDVPLLRPGGSGVLFDEAGELYVADVLGDHFLRRLHRTEGPRPVAPRPADFAGTGSPYPEFTDEQWPLYRKSAVRIATSGRNLVVADAITGHLLVYRGDSLVSRLALPLEMEAEVLAAGGPVAFSSSVSGFSPAFQALQATPGGRLLLTFATAAGSRLFGLLIDPAAGYRATPIVLGALADEPRPGQRAVAYRDGHLISVFERIYLVDNYIGPRQTNPP
jgi:hypothetical protein